MHRTVRRNDGSLGRKQIQALLGLSNVRPVSAAIEHLGLEPTNTGAWSNAGYNNGGFYGHWGDTPYYSPECVALIQAELESESELIDLKKRKFSYRGISYRLET